MTPRTIFILILKIIGLYMVFDFVIFIPQAFTRFPLMWMNGMDISATILLISLIVVILLIYFFLIRLFLFKTNWIIDKLSLDKHFDQETIIIKMDSLAVIQIAIILLGGIFFADALPSLFREVVAFLQQKGMDILLAKSPNFSYMVFDACKLTIGYLLLTNSNRLALWIEQKNGRQDKNDTSTENQEQ